MRRWTSSIGILIGLISIASAIGISAQAAIVATDDQAMIEFPDRITFSVNLKSDTEIDQVVLEYGVDQLTCGKVVAKAFPDFGPSKNVTAKWAWEMKQTGSQPPGSHIWWRWRVTDANGHETVTDQQATIWLDGQHPWQTVNGRLLNLHWYIGGASFGPELHDSAVNSLDQLAKSTGLKLDSPTDLYIYADTQDMRDAILYEPGWTGGLAYPDHNIVIIGISPDQLNWGKRTEAHELTHVLVGHLTFSCLGDVPTWLNEGLAVSGEGGPDQAARSQFDTAVAEDKLISVRSLSGGFSEDPVKADLSYSESYSLANFLVTQYGQDKMLALLKQLRDGTNLDDAMQSIYGLNIDGFEDAWRTAIGAKPRSTSHTTLTPTLIPTMVPTFVPVSAAPVGPTISPTRDRPTPQPIAQAPAGAKPSGPGTAPATPAQPLQADVVIFIIICLMLLAGVILILVVRRQHGTKS